MLILYLEIGVFKSRKCLSPKRALKTRTAATKWPREEEKPESTIYRKWSERCVVKTVKTAGIIRRRRCEARGVRGEGSRRAVHVHRVEEGHDGKCSGGARESERGTERDGERDVVGRARGSPLLSAVQQCA